MREKLELRITISLEQKDSIENQDLKKRSQEESQIVTRKNYKLICFWKNSLHLHIKTRCEIWFNVLLLKEEVNKNRRHRVGIQTCGMEP